MFNKIGIVLAAGKGTRMKSRLPKPLHNIKGKSMLFIIVEKLLKLNLDKILIVISGDCARITNNLNNELHVYLNLDNETINDKISFIIQQQTLGTGHAVKCCLTHLSKYKDYSSLIVFADTPLISYNTLNNITNMDNECNECIVGVCNKLNPFGSGRIILEDDYIINSIEEKDCNEEQRKITLVNTGIYYINNKLIIDYIDQIENNNSQKEYYLPDLLLILIKNKYKVKPFIIQNEIESLNVNTQEDLQNAIENYNQETKYY